MKFSDLRTQFSEFLDRTKEDWHASNRFALRLAESLRSFLDAPDKYQDSSGRSHRYISSKSVEIDEHNNLILIKEDKGFDVIIPNMEGDWAFALQITLDIAEDFWPKRSLWFGVHFSLNADRYKLHLSHEDSPTFEGDINNEEDIERIHIFILDKISNFLKSAPNRESVSDNGIGFLRF